VNSLDPVGEVARLLALNLKAAIGEMALRDAANLAGIDHSTLYAILQGNSWPDISTLAKLERGLNCDLWPGRPS